MIRDFKMTDLGYFLPNAFSNPDQVLDQLRDGEYITLSVWDKDMVAAILVFREYAEKCWEGSILLAEDLRSRVIIYLQKYMHEKLEEAGAVRLQTRSLAHPVLDSWHQFLGFEEEGLHKKMMFGQDYKTWAIVR